MVAKRSREEELALDSDTLLKKLRVLDPGINPLDYWVAGSCVAADGSAEDEEDEDGEGGRWDHAALAEDVWLTSQYVTAGLEGALRPLRADMSKVLAPAATSLSSTARDATEVVPGQLVLGNAASARDIQLLRRLGVRRVVNVSPQTVRLGAAVYERSAAGQILEYREVWADDLPDYCIMDHFDEVWDVISRSRDDGGACLLHCEQGVNRSGALMCAAHMRLTMPGARMAPEELFWRSWKAISEARGGGRGIVTNVSFQRQLLLFARLGCQWWQDLPSVSLLWRTPHEQAMAAFRSLAEHVAQRVVCGYPGAEPKHHKYLVTLVRDGVMRGESKLPIAQAFDMKDGERRITSYATKYLEKKVKALSG